jgi:hypothetical protein
MATTASKKEPSPSKLIDERIKELDDWRGETLAKIRSLIKQAVPDVAEEWKWRGVPVWERDGIIWIIQFEPRGKRSPGHRLSRRRKDRREGVQSVNHRGGEPQYRRQSGKTKAAYVKEKGTGRESAVPFLHVATAS